MRLMIKKLTCERQINPLGIDSPDPTLGWILESSERSVTQTAYQIHVSVCPDFSKTTWDSGKVISDQSNNITYSGSDLQSTTLYYWKATVWDNRGNQAESDVAFFETAFMNTSDWKAVWVEPIQEPAYEEVVKTFDGFHIESSDIEDIKMLPAKIIRKDFVLDKPVKNARAYATAHGVYYIEINGQIIGDQELAPGDTTYHRYLEYQTYDITSCLKDKNAIGMVIGDGWYAGKNGMTGASVQYGNTLAGLFQLEIEFQDGSRMTVCSDAKCLGTDNSPIYYNDLFVGEGYDATKEQHGFSTYGFCGDHWQPVQIKSYDLNRLHAQYGEPVRVTQRITPKIIIAPNGDILLDAGQVLTGRTMMKVTAPRGTKISLQHTEILTKEGNYLQNILGRMCKQEDTYICKGEGVETFLPRFTSHGFRYVRIKGYPDMPKAEDFEIQVLNSDMAETGAFSCSDLRLNQLQHNILWSQKSNMLSIPTDCPQRERAGWTGDAQIFAPTSCFNMNVAMFWRRWLHNMQNDQQEDGQIPVVVPYLKAYGPEVLPLPGRTHCSAGWGDAAIIVPRAVYRAYGDVGVLADNYDMMCKWVEYIRLTAAEELPEHLRDQKLSNEEREVQKYLWNTNFHFGDWLTPSVSFNFETGDVDMVASAFKTMDIVPTCFYAYSTQLMVEIATVLGKTEDADYYNELNRKVKWAFRKAYVDEHGLIKTELQGIYVLALQCGLIPENLEQNAIHKLLEMIRANGNKLDTGILSTPYLLDILQQKGHLMEAYNLLFQDECPSWLYKVKMGATTMWEAWQSVLPDGTPTSVSYNHYAFGCIGDWMYRNIAGLEAKAPGYKVTRFKPEMDARITSAKATIESVYGHIAVNWHTENDRMLLQAKIPANTSGEIVLPGAAGASVSERGIPIEQAEGVINVTHAGDSLVITAGSGCYEFSYLMASK